MTTHMRPAVVVAATTGLVAAAITAGAATVIAAASGRPAQDELPCGITFDRTVEPHQVVVSDTVHVTIEVNGECTVEQKGIDIFFVVDRTITMREEGYLEATQDALKDYLNAMPFPPSNAGLITYAARDQVNVPLTDERARVIQGVDRIRIREETDVRGLPVAFRTATELIDQDGDPDNEKVIMVVAAGPDQDGDLVNMPTVTQAARNAGVKVVFLLFPDARYEHYVEAASDCTGGHCQTWSLRSGNITKWAYPVEKDGANGIDSWLQRLVPVMLREITLDSLEVEEFMSSGAVVVQGSVQPPPTHHAGGAPYRDMVWEFDSITPGGIVIEYDAAMIYEDEVYQVTELSMLFVWDTAGQLYDEDLPNPDITVLGAVTPTATPSPMSTTPGPGPSETPTPVGTGTDGEAAVFLPLALLKDAP